MGHFEPGTVTQLVDVLNEVCRALEEEYGRPLDGYAKNNLAKLIIRSYEAGISDPAKLKADTLRAAGHLILAQTS
jgi:hypothetical protein